MPGSREQWHADRGGRRGETRWSLCGHRWRGLLPESLRMPPAQAQPYRLTNLASSVTGPLRLSPLFSPTPPIPSDKAGTPLFPPQPSIYIRSPIPKPGAGVPHIGASQSCGEARAG